MSLIVHRTQRGWGKANLCGQACASMVLLPAVGVDKTPRQIAAETNTDDNTFTSMGELASILRHFGAGYFVSNVADMEMHRRMIQSHYRPITLIDYRKIVNKAGGYSNYDYGHWVVIESISDTEVRFHDPLQLSQVTVEPLESFRAAVESQSQWIGKDKDGNKVKGLNPANLSIFVQGVAMGRGAGINLDVRHPEGRPTVSQLEGFSSARLLYNVSNGIGSQNVEASEALYRPYISALVNAGISPVIILNHQTYGESAGYNWEQMTPITWAQFRANFVAVARNIASRYRGFGITWQICNEQDSLDSRASVIIPPEEYGRIFNEAYVAIKAADPDCRVITGGYNSGATRGAQQFLAARISQCDGVAFHPYGASAAGLYAQDGIPSINEQIRQWRSVTKLPLYVTEFGFTNAQQEAPDKVSRYIDAFVMACAKAENVMPPMWYAWSSRMDNAYGVIAPDTSVRTAVFLALTDPIYTAKPPVPFGYPVKPGVYRVTLKSGISFVNGREEPKTVAPVLESLTNGRVIEVLDAPLSDYMDKYYWFKAKVVASNKEVWVAITGNYTLEAVADTPKPPEENPSLTAMIHALKILLAEIDALNEAAKILQDEVDRLEAL